MIGAREINAGPDHANCRHRCQPEDYPDIATAIGEERSQTPQKHG
jgi:hypothetical protein